MPAPSHLDHFDLDIGLRDASCDENLPPVRRGIAALCIGVGVDDAYLSVRELREAVSLVHENAPGGRAKLAGILSTQCDDFQRAIYYCLAGRGVVEIALAHGCDVLSEKPMANSRAEAESLLATATA